MSSLRDIAMGLEGTMKCTCDLDRWQPEKLTGHSWVCDIHKAAMKQVSVEQLISELKAAKEDAG